MKKEQALQYITNAMSLRTPQDKSLALFADYLEGDAGKKVLAIGEGEKGTPEA